MLSVRDFRIGVRLCAGFAVLLLLIFMIAAMGARNVDRVQDGLKTVYEDRVVPLQQLGTINALMMRNRILLMDMMLNTSDENLQRRSAEVMANVDRVSATWQAYMATYLTNEEKLHATAFAKAREAYVTEGIKSGIEALHAGHLDRARDIYGSKVSPLAQDAQGHLDKMIKLQVDVAAQEYAYATAMEQEAYVMSVVSTGAAIALGALLAWWLTRTITLPLREAVEAARRMRSGDLTCCAATRSSDEVGQLLLAMGAMQRELTGIVGSVRANAEGVATAAAQIAQGNLDLSGRTEEQASSLQQTAASMEELSAAVRHNASHARQANELAIDAAQVARHGGVVVGDFVTTMKDIEASSRQIASIVAVIDGIAFQTNILALNAAVEAARAAEHGRGFAVVAGEVRSLAQRSSDSARQIRELIADSAERVARGTEVVDQAGQSMTELVHAIERVAQLVGDISAASDEQSLGVGQVGQAVSQMDRVTQQNAALVEEGAAAAESLKTQADRLVQSVAIFKLDIESPPKAMA